MPRELLRRESVAMTIGRAVVGSSALRTKTVTASLMFVRSAESVSASAIDGDFGSGLNHSLT